MDYLKKSLFNTEYNEEEYNKILLRSFYYYEKIPDNYKEEYNKIFDIKPEDLLNYNLKGGNNLKKKIKKSQYQFLINLQYHYLLNYYYPNNFITIQQIENAFDVNYKNDKKITIEERKKEIELQKQSLINIEKQNTDLINNIKQILQNLINDDTLKKFNQFYYNKLLVFLNNVENIFLSIDKDNNTTDIYTKTKQSQELYDKLVNIKSSLEQIKKEIETNKNYITQYNSNNLGVSISKQIDFINNKLNDIKTNNIELSEDRKKKELEDKLKDYYTKITNNKELREKYEKITKGLNDEEIDKLIEKYKLNLEIKRKIVESFSGGGNIEKLNELYDLMIIDNKINKEILSKDNKLQKLLENINLYEIVKDKNIEIVINEFKTEERKAKEQAEREQAEREAKEQAVREQADSKSEEKEQVDSKSEEKEQADVKTEEKADAKPEEKADVKTEEKVDAKPEEKSDVKPEEKADVKTEEKVDAKPEEKSDVKTEKKTEEEKDKINNINCENITKFKQNQNDCWLDTFFVVMTADELNTLFKMFLNKVLEEDKDLFNSIINYIEYIKETDKAQLKTDFVQKFVNYYNNKIKVKIDNDVILDEYGNGRINFVIIIINTLFDDVKLSVNTDFDKKYFIHIIQSDNNNKITEITDNNYTLKAIYYPQGELHYEGYYKCNNKWLFYDNQDLPIKEINIDDLTQKSETYLFFVRNEDEEINNVEETKTEETKDETKTEEKNEETKEKEFDITKNYLNDFLEINTTQFNILKNKKIKKLDTLENEDKQKIINLMNEFIKNHKQNLKDYKFKNKDNVEKKYFIKYLNNYDQQKENLQKENLQQYFNNLKNVVKNNLNLYIDNIEVKNLNQLISKLEKIFELNEDVSEKNLIEFKILLLLQFNNVVNSNEIFIKNYFQNNDDINNLFDEILYFNNNDFYKDKKYNFYNINKLYNLQDNLIFILNDYYSCYELINYIRDKIKLKIDFDFTNCINDFPRLLDIYYNEYGINNTEKIKTPKFNKDTKYIIDDYLKEINKEYIEDKDNFINLLKYINDPNSIKKEENKLEDFKESEEDIEKCKNIVNKFTNITNYESWSIDCNEISGNYIDNIYEIYQKKYNGETNLDLINLDFNDFSNDIIDEYMKQITKNKIETKEEFEELINFIKSKKSPKDDKVEKDCKSKNHIVKNCNSEEDYLNQLELFRETNNNGCKDEAKKKKKELFNNNECKEYKKIKIDTDKNEIKNIEKYKEKEEKIEIKFFNNKIYIPKTRKDKSKRKSFIKQIDSNVMRNKDIENIIKEVKFFDKNIENDKQTIGNSYNLVFNLHYFNKIFCCTKKENEIIKITDKFPGGIFTQIDVSNFNRKLFKYEIYGINEEKAEKLKELCLKVANKIDDVVLNQGDDFREFIKEDGVKKLSIEVENFFKEIILTKDEKIEFIINKKTKSEEIKITKITDNELELFKQNEYYDWLGLGLSNFYQKYKLFEPNRFNVINKNNNEYYDIIPLYYIENINNINNNNLDIINEYLNNNLKVYPENDYPEKYKINNDLLKSFLNKKKNNLPFWLSLGKFYLKTIINEKINIHINNAWRDHMVKGYGKVVTCFIINYFKNKYPNKELYITLKEGGGSSKAWKRHGFVLKSKKDTHPFTESFSHKLDINESKKICTKTLNDFNITEFKYYEIDNQTGGKIDKIIENMVNEYNNKKVKKYKIVKKLN